MTNLEYLVKLLIASEQAMRILHWKSSGKGFDTAHKWTDKYVDKLCEMIDEAQESALVYNFNPPSLKDCADIDEPAVKVDPSQDYDLEQVFDKVKEIFNALIKCYQKVLKENLSAGIRSQFETRLYYLTIEDLYKIKRTLL